MNEMMQRCALAAHKAAYASRDEFLMPNWFKVAEAIIEELRDVPEVNYSEYNCDKQWKDLTSKEVWDLWLDTVVK